ncbi:DNA-binding transcriptional regulator YhcF (GntR family) [Symbiobacterium terraclitae]|uniref:DNA-binding transcriptional regulator YhcF (GntR family) n=1 Tax=Symbiobacterium terraclitae TaxID=557451 RepID=A0ABS4JSC4_9FIRM|nr:DNA-binding transcriptional regulator YhcF (GntR family) [Symbiobacterium terraclitae]
MISVQAFRLDPTSSLPVREQIKAQIRYQVAAGLLYPGDQLPSLRDLAAGLAVNVNTAVRAVEDLVREGYLVSHQGRGVFVAEDPPGAAPGAALRSLLAGALASASEWGMSPSALAEAVTAQSQLARSPQPASGRVVLAATSRADLRALQRQLEAVLPGTTVVPSLPEELGHTAPSTPVAATLFHAAALEERGAVALAGKEDLEALRRLAALPRGTPVAVAAADWVQAARVRQSLERGGMGHLAFRLATSPVDLAAALDGAAVLLAAPSGRRMAEEARAARPDLPCLFEPISPPPEAVSALRHRLSAPQRPSRVAVRSSWV